MRNRPASTSAPLRAAIARAKQLGLRPGWDRPVKRQENPHEGRLAQTLGRSSRERTDPSDIQPARHDRSARPSAFAVRHGGAFAATGHAPGGKREHPGKSDEATEKSEGAEGGTTIRFHGDDQSTCALLAGAEAMSGNWNHGSFVSAWAKAFASGNGVAAATIGSVRDAAHSNCGKPTHSFGQGKSAEQKP